jgi:hypothetical protein
MKWNKNTDWLPLDNAKAQVAFWRKDLKASENYLKLVLSYKNKFKNEQFWKKALKQAEKDIKVSEEGLKKALEKLEESEKLEKIYS